MFWQGVNTLRVRRRRQLSFLNMSSQLSGTAKIVVVGASGSGKSSFINTASGSMFEVGAPGDLHRKTSVIQATEPFDIGGTSVVLIDTPGFDEDAGLNIDIFNDLQNFLKERYGSETRLNGVIYLHSIADRRFGCPMRRNLHVYRALCGDKILKNVTIATTMWDVVSEGQGQSRELELQSDERFFKPLLDHQAKMRKPACDAANGFVDEVVGRDGGAPTRRM
ncbi:P-loop containing nucleoside triphosphate hydrolase protein [Abortiporus biennis]|nr:P-loop containing nucleoside triphosphate hydrolase protein [Abortiporus biennis]